jgi:hypothetical protein
VFAALAVSHWIEHQTGWRIEKFVSMLPGRGDVLALLVEVDTGVGSWTPDERSDTPQRLHVLAERNWRPQDCALLGDYATSSDVSND